MLNKKARNFMNLLLLPVLVPLFFIGFLLIILGNRYGTLVIRTVQPTRQPQHLHLSVGLEASTVRGQEKPITIEA